MLHWSKEVRSREEGATLAVEPSIVWLPLPSLLLKLFQKDPQVGYAFVSKRKASGGAAP